MNAPLAIARGMKAKQRALETVAGTHPSRQITTCWIKSSEARGLFVAKTLQLRLSAVAQATARDAKAPVQPVSLKVATSKAKARDRVLGSSGSQATPKHRNPEDQR